MPGEVGLRQRLIAAGLSVFEPDPLSAIEAATKSEDGTVPHLDSPSPAEPVA